MGPVQFEVIVAADDALDVGIGVVALVAVGIAVAVAVATGLAVATGAALPLATGTGARLAIVEGALDDGAVDALDTGEALAIGDAVARRTAVPVLPFEHDATPHDASTTIEMKNGRVFNGTSQEAKGVSGKRE